MITPINETKVIRNKFNRKEKIEFYDEFKNRQVPYTLNVISS